MEEEELLVGAKTSVTTLEISGSFLKQTNKHPKLKRKLLYDPAISILGICPSDGYRLIMFTVALFIIVRK